MLNRTPRSSLYAFSYGLITSGAIATVMAGVSALAIGASFQSFFEGNGARVSFGDATWWAHLPLKPAPAHASLEEALGKPWAPRVAQTPRPVPQRNAGAERRAPRRVHAVIAVPQSGGRSELRSRVASARVEGAVEAPIRHSAALAVGSAAVLIEPPLAPKAPTLSPVVDEQELSAMRGIHQGLTTRFRIAASPASVEQAPPVLAAAPVGPAPGVVTTQAPRAKPEEEPVPIVAPRVVTQAPTMIQRPPVRALRVVVPRVTSPVVPVPTAQPQTPVVVSSRSATQPSRTALLSDLGPVPADRGYRAVEAFDDTTPVDGATIRVWSDEGLGTDENGKWIEAEAPAHWPVLSWSEPGIPGERVPLLSVNAAEILERIAGVTIQERAAIVFGRVPAGWTIDYSGRSDAPIYLSDSLVQTQAGAMDTQYFALLNAAPGMHLLYLSRERDHAQVAVAVPVLPGRATAVSLSAPKQIALRGEILNAASPARQGLSEVKVSVVGQNGISAVTSAHGDFSIPSVWSVSGFPLYVETERATEQTHRYKIHPGQKFATLYRFPPSRLRLWIGQLEGRVSPEGGLVVAALPEAFAVAQKAEASAFPSVSSAVESTLIPETYTLASNDELMVKHPLTQDSPRFISVQVPEGANIARLEDQRGVRVWSELVVSSPSVVTLVGPR